METITTITNGTPTLLRKHVLRKCLPLSLAPAASVCAVVSASGTATATLVGDRGAKHGTWRFRVLS